MRIFPMLCLALVAGCGDRSETRIQSDPPRFVRVEEVVPPGGGAGGDLKIESTIRPERVGAPKYVFQFTVRVPRLTGLGFSFVHRIAGALQDAPWFLVRLDDPPVFESPRYQLAWGHVHELEIRVSAAGESPDFHEPAARARLPLARTLVVRLTEDGR